MTENDKRYSFSGDYYFKKDVLFTNDVIEELLDGKEGFEMDVYIATMRKTASGKRKRGNGKQYVLKYDKGNFTFDVKFSEED